MYLQFTALAKTTCSSAQCGFTYLYAHLLDCYRLGQVNRPKIFVVVISAIVFTMHVLLQPIVSWCYL